MFHLKRVSRKLVRQFEMGNLCLNQKLLLIGPCKNKKNPLLTGGVIVLFEQFIKDLRTLGAEFSVVDTNMANYPNRLIAIISIYWQIVKKQRYADHVSLHGTINNYLYIAPFVILLSSIYGKRTSLRKFAGSLNEAYENSGRLKKWILEFVLQKTDYAFYETKYLVEYFRRWNKRSYWFPNVRQKQVNAPVPRKFNKRFVFISHVIKSKGIDIILKASKEFDESYTFDIYGPILNNEYSVEDFKGYNVSYKGPLKTDEVVNVLDKYDVLMLPSYREGYPGIIIEAYSLGIPVISTRLESIKEICEDGKDGYLIDPGDVGQFSDAIHAFNGCSYGELSLNAFNKFDLFDSESYSCKFLEIIGSE